MSRSPPSKPSEHSNSSKAAFEKDVAQHILASVQKAVVGEAGKTGTWRTMRPILHPEKCLVVKSGRPTCHYCWLYCPEATVSRTIPPQFNYEYCKGCGVCAKECPVKAIEMIPDKDPSNHACELNEATQIPPEP